MTYRNKNNQNKHTQNKHFHKKCIFVCSSVLDQIRLVQRAILLKHTDKCFIVPLFLMRP